MFNLLSLLGFVGALDEALGYIAELEARLQAMSMGPQTVISRFCVSDRTMRYYTRFPSQEVFNTFWESVCPSTQYIVYWTRAQKLGEVAFPAPSPSRKVPIIDELFIYCCRVAAGLKEQVIQYQHFSCEPCHNNLGKLPLHGVGLTTLMDVQARSRCVNACKIQIAQSKAQGHP